MAHSPDSFTQYYSSVIPSFFQKDFFLGASDAEPYAVLAFYKISTDDEQGVIRCT